MNQQQPAFDVNAVQIPVVLNPSQVGLIMKGLSKLPLEEVDQLYHGLRQVAEQTISAASKKHAEDTAAAEAAANEPAAEEPAGLSY